MIQDKKLQVEFKDANNVLFKINVELRKKDDGTELAITGEGDGACGQVLDHIKPLNQGQKDLVAIWREYHLNGMNAGTEEQTKVLNQMKGNYDYDKAKRFLDSHGRDGKPITAFEVDEINKTREDLKNQIKAVKEELEQLAECESHHKEKIGMNIVAGGWIVWRELGIKEHFGNQHQFKGFFTKEERKRNNQIEKLQKTLDETNMQTMLFSEHKGEVYEYGTAWIHKELPKDLWTKLERNIIPYIEKVYKLNRKTGGDWKDIGDYKIVALGKHLGIDPSEAEDDIKEIGDGTYSYCGTDYYVLTEDEAYDKCEEYLDDELWKMAVESDSTTLGKEEWVEYVISKDGYGHILNGHDGRQYHDSDHDVYIMRA